jgi:nucleotide-binding universal stress UspA family protein
MRAKGIRASGVAVVGWNAAESILQAARPEQVSLIVLATHGRGGLRRLALGSIADKLVRAGDVPVLVCHPSGKAGSKKRSPRQTSSSRRGAGRRAR